jgi:6-methylsalicylate decarboxylase
MNVIPGAREQGRSPIPFRGSTGTPPRRSVTPCSTCLRSVTGLGNVLFGTDYPYPRDAISIAGLRRPESSAELDDGERRRLLSGSAATLIRAWPKWGSTA